VQPDRAVEVYESALKKNPRDAALASKTGQALVKTHQYHKVSGLSALIQLHWLPVKQRALYKLALITFNVLQHNNPMYLRDLLTTHNPSRNLRSSSQHLLSVGYMRTVSSSRCFKHSAAINWNDLPFDIRACDSVNVFKRKLKSHLFNIAFAT